MAGLWPVLGAALLTASLVLPGWGWARAARWPMPWFVAGVISVLAIFAGVFLCAVAHLPITRVSIATWLALFGGTGAFLALRRGGPAGDPEASMRSSARPGRWAWIALPAVLVAVWRAWLQPLSGVDVDFRWNHLAELIARTGRMDFYPPASPADFAWYFWADGIAPLVASLYAWTYLLVGEIDRHWTAVPVLLQVAALFALARNLARQQGAPDGGGLAVACVGATFLLQFAFNLGQETGCTTLGCAGMVFYLGEHRRIGAPRLLVPAALCATLAACAREYGIAFAAGGAAWLMIHRVPRTHVLAFTAGSLVLPACWHLRNWAVTGDPFFAINPGGWFAANPVFARWMEMYADVYGSHLAFRTSAGWMSLARLVVVGALPAMFGLVLLARLWPRDRALAASLLFLTGAGFAAWVAAMPFTAGGLFYSMRILAPLLLIGCVAAGVALARWTNSRRRAVLVGLLLGAGSLDAALRSLTVPANPYETPARDWPRIGYQIQRDFAERDRGFLAEAAARATGKTLSESAGAQRVFLAAHRELVPLWSPDVALLFGPAGASDAVEQLVARGYSHLLITRAATSVQFLADTGALARLEGQLEPVMSNDTFAFFALRPRPKPGTGP